MSYLENIRTFVRVYELGSMSAAGRDLRISPAVTSARISQLENHLGVRLFQRTTRSLTPTQQGRAFYGGACVVLDAVDHAEAQVSSITENPKGVLHVAAPLGVGRRLIAPLVPDFAAAYPLIDIRLRLTDRNVDLTSEGLDIAFFLGEPEDSAFVRSRNVHGFWWRPPAMLPPMAVRLMGQPWCRRGTIASICAFLAPRSSNGACKRPTGRSAFAFQVGLRATMEMC